MAPSYGDQLSTNTLDSTKLLQRYKCKLCSKWKPAANFSNKELSTYMFKAATSGNAGGESTHLQCVICTDDQRQELECQGPCGLVLPLSAFSKASRKAGGNKWCPDCTNWKEAAEPDVVVGPAPNTMLAPDEAWDGNPELGSEADDGTWDDDTQEPNSSAWYARGGSISTFTGSMAPASVAYETTKQAEITEGMAKLGIKVNNNERARARADDEMNSTSSVSNQYEDLASVDLGGDWEATDARRREPITFNAYDPEGQLHRRMQTSLESEAGQSSSTMRAPVSTGANNTRKFAKPTGTRKPNPKLPSNFSALTAAGSATIPRSRAVYSIEDDSDGDDH